MSRWECDMDGASVRYGLGLEGDSNGDCDNCNNCHNGWHCNGDDKLQWQ
jgi:hypothetical protein